ncbi:hypothetical protein BGZ92_008071 [Podila epicladia]|nr:hypothetical protein BGZ92_008071 [Podila epicladia]
MSQDQSGEASSQQQQEQTPRPEVAQDPGWMERHLMMYREMLMITGSHGRGLQFDGSLASIRQTSRDDPHWGKTEQELIQMEIQNIEELVANEADLQPYLDAVLASCQEFEARKRQEEEDMKNYRAEHPEHLVMSSVRKLEMYGRWSMSDEVLELMLGRVFRNIRFLDQCMCEGYSLDAFVRVTQSMPWLTRVQAVDPVDLSCLSDAYKLQAHTASLIPPYNNDAATRVMYSFGDRMSYVRRNHSLL